MSERDELQENIEALEGKLSAIASEAQDWKSLMEHPGWIRLTKLMETQKNLRSSAVMLTPIAGEHTVFAQEYLKGEVSGINQVLLMPATQYQVADLQRKTVTKELEAEHETETAISAASAGRGDDTFG